MAKKDITPKDPQANETTEAAVEVAGQERMTQAIRAGRRKMGRKTSACKVK